MEKLASIVEKFTGSVLCVGVSDEGILKKLQHNPQVTVFTVERDFSRGIFSRRKKAKMKEEKNKKINMKKLRKVFQKKSVDYIVCDLIEIYDYFKYFLYDSVIINKKKLYLYGNSKYIDPYRLAKRFKRYHASSEVSISDNKFLIVVDNQNSKGNWFQSKWYIIVDSFHNLGDMISAALIS